MPRRPVRDASLIVCVRSSRVDGLIDQCRRQRPEHVDLEHRGRAVHPVDRVVSAGVERCHVRGEDATDRRGRISTDEADGAQGIRLRSRAGFEPGDGGRAGTQVGPNRRIGVQLAEHVGDELGFVRGGVERDDRNGLVELAMQRLLDECRCWLQVRRPGRGLAQVLVPAGIAGAAEQAEHDEEPEELADRVPLLASVGLGLDLVLAPSSCSDVVKSVSSAAAQPGLGSGSEPARLTPAAPVPRTAAAGASVGSATTSGIACDGSAGEASRSSGTKMGTRIGSASTTIGGGTTGAASAPAARRSRPAAAW